MSSIPIEETQTCAPRCGMAPRDLAPVALSYGSDAQRAAWWRRRTTPIAQRRQLWLEIVMLRDAGVSLPKLGRAMGLTPARVHQLERKGRAWKRVSGCAA